MGATCMKQKLTIQTFNPVQKKKYQCPGLLNSIIVDIRTYNTTGSIIEANDSINFSQQSIKINDTCQLFKQHNNQINIVKLYQKNSSLQLATAQSCKEYDFKFNKTNDGYWFNCNQSTQVWKRILQKEIEIKENDILKIGLTKIKLKKIIYESNYLQKQSKSERVIQSIAHISEEQCRICLDSSETKTNPLISPCECMGSVKYIHLHCLKDWLFSSQNSSEDFISIDLKKSQCEICKASMLQTSFYESIIATILSGSKSLPTPFAIFQGIYVDKQKKGLKTYFIYSFQNKNTFIIGRGKKAELRADLDKSISRCHAQITFKDNKMFIKDRESKYGTLLNIKLPIFLPFNCDIHNFQINKSHVSITYERSNLPIQQCNDEIMLQKQNRNSIKIRTTRNTFYQNNQQI